MERQALQELIEWKGRSDRKPLILRGARRVGKTWLLREFARRQYAKEAYVICRKNDMVQQVFSQDFDVHRILCRLSAITGVDITPNDTLLILDEVQEIPEAIESLKYFCELAPDYHIAVAGSFVGISMHKGISFPAGKVNELNIYPMSFEEFVLARGERDVYELLKLQDHEIMNLVHEKMVELLRQYYYVGGMPEAVAEFVEKGRLREVRRIQQEILHGYDQDFSKHAPAEQVPRIRMVWNSIPSQFFLENKKFIYSTLCQGARVRDFEFAIQWLLDAGLLIRVPRCSKFELPFTIYEEPPIFKLYLNDVGLLGAMVNTEASEVIVGDEAFTEYKGILNRHYVLQQMVNHDVGPIYYYITDNCRLDIDFVIQYRGKLLPIEVKTGGSIRANTFSTFLKAHADIHAVRYSMHLYKEQEQVVNLPFYAAGVFDF